MRAFLYLAALVCLLNLLVILAVGQQVAPLDVEDALGTRDFGQNAPIQFSPDGKWLVITVKDNRKSASASLDNYALTGVSSGTIGVDIFLVNVATGEMKNLTGGTGSNWAPCWSPDGHYLAFISDRDGSGGAKLWVWQSSDGNMRKVSELDVRTFWVQGANGIQWLPNSRGVLVTVIPENLTPVQYVERSGSISATKKEDETRAPGSTVVVYRSAKVSDSRGATGQSDPWNLERSLRDLVLIDLTTGRTLRLDHGHRISGYRLSPDGSHVAFTSAKRFEKPGSQQVLFDLSIVKLATGESKLLAADIRLLADGTQFSWSPSSVRLVYQATGMEANGDCFIIDIGQGGPRNLTNFSSKAGGLWAPLWDVDGQSLYFVQGPTLWKVAIDQNKTLELAKIADHRIVSLISGDRNRLWSPDGGQSTVLLTYDNLGKQSGFYRVDLTNGQTTRLLEKNQCYTCLNTTQFVAPAPAGNQLAYFVADSQHDTDLWLADSDFRASRRLTHLNEQFDKHEMGKARLVEWRSLDGEKLRGALLLPAGYQEGKRYPLIVYVYGGLMLSDNVNHFGLGVGGFTNMQLFATRGYVVFEPDAPQHLGTPMLDLAKTILPGIDKVIEMGIADPDRLGVWGQSYGGYTTLSLIVQTRRFKAALAADGFADYMGLYGQMDKSGTAFGTSIAEQGQGKLGGTPWQFRDRYVENSPIFYLDRIETPLLLVHGAADTTAAPFLSDEIFVGLRRLGKEVVYAKYEGEGIRRSIGSTQTNRTFASV